MIEDFVARRRAVIERQRLLIEEMQAEDERDHQIHRAEQEFEDWLERERVKREKYAQVMAEKISQLNAQLNESSTNKTNERPAKSNR